MNEAVFAPIFEVMLYAVAWMKVTLVPATPITFYQLWIGVLASTTLIDALKTFLPKQNEDD